VAELHVPGPPQRRALLPPDVEIARAHDELDRLEADFFDQEHFVYCEIGRERHFRFFGYSFTVMTSWGVGGCSCVSMPTTLVPIARNSSTCESHPPWVCS